MSQFAWVCNMLWLIEKFLMELFELRIWFKINKQSMDRLPYTYIHIVLCTYEHLGILVEQIIAYGRRIVQIMIQATDLAHILYKDQPSRKKRGPRKISIWPPFSKMAAMGYPEILFFYLNGQQMVEKDNYDKRFYVLSIANVQIMS